MTQNPSWTCLVLASQSPIRAGLLRAAGLVFDTHPAHVDETALIGRTIWNKPSALALDLAIAKACSISEKDREAVIIGADQLLVFDDEPLQKPADLSAARDRLMLLSGHRHQLVTAVVLARNGEIVWQHAETGTLWMHDLSPEEIAHYLEEDTEALQSVGAYRLEGPGIRLFDRLDGDYFAMLGLPLAPLLTALRRQVPDSLPGVVPK